MARVAVTALSMPGGGLDLLRQEHEVLQWAEPERAPSRDELPALLAGAEALISTGIKVPAEVMDLAPGLKIIATPSAGYDAIDIEAAAERGIVVTNTPGVLHETTADLTIALMLMARRMLVARSDQMRSGRWGPFGFGEGLGLDVWGSRLGLIGYGEIGQAVARRGRGFGMSVQHSFSSRPTDDYSTAVSFEELLATSDIVSLHVPLAENTRELIGVDALAAMKPSATLVNTARGAVVDQDALVDAIQAGRLHSAGLDVFAHEPLVDIESPLMTHERIVVLPHIGSATEVTRARQVALAAENVLAVLSGSSALTPVEARTRT